MDNKDILSMDPLKLIDWIKEEFVVEIPAEINTTEDMENAAKLLLKLSSSYSFLSMALARAKRNVRVLKREDKKTEAEDMIDRRDILHHMTEVVKQAYGAVSRSVTIKIENNRELQMSGYVKQ